MSEVHQWFEERKLALDAATSRFPQVEALLPEMNSRHVSDDGIVELLLPAALANAIVR